MGEELVPIEADPILLLEQHGYLTTTGLNLPEDLPFDDYVSVGRGLANRRKRVMWQISEWLLFGERVYGETYTQAAEITGLSPDTLKQYVYTANKVPRERRRAELGFSHHQVVAGLQPDEQDEWLDKAVVNGWNRAELRAHLFPVENGKVKPALPDLEEAARSLVAGASQSGIDFVVKRQHLSDLAAALQEEFDF